MFELILKITLAHLLGDFVFQSDKMVDEIENKKLKSIYLYVHALIHLFLLLAITKLEKNYILPAILLSLSHLFIDIFTKIVIKNRLKGIYNLLIDQLLHIITIALFVSYFYDYKIDFELLFSSKSYLLIISIIIVTYVSSVIIKKVMEIFNYPLPNDGIKDAGKYIGMLERILIFVFVITTFWEGIGFLLAAKSIFRFGDLKENKEIKLTEYILIGTLLSFGIAIIIGKMYLKLNSFQWH
jgi:Protein of unknown function (DUF3307)